jgi:hypothetical protein
MINLTTFRQIALSFPEATEAPHFEKPSFRIGKKYLPHTTVKINRPALNYLQPTSIFFQRLTNPLFLQLQTNGAHRAGHLLTLTK